MGNIGVLVAEPHQQVADQEGLTLLQVLGSHVVEQVGHALHPRLPHLALGVGQGGLQPQLQVLEVGAGFAGDEKAGYCEQCFFPHLVLVVLQVVGESLNDGQAVLAQDVPEAEADIDQQVTGKLIRGTITILMLEEGSPRHFAIPAASSPMLGTRLSLN